MSPCGFVATYLDSVCFASRFPLGLPVAMSCCCFSLSVGGIRGLQKECRGSPPDKAKAVLGEGVVADQGVLDDGLHALDER